MVVAEPIAIIAAVLAVLATGGWVRVVRALAVEGGVARSGDELQQAAVLTALTLGTGALAILGPTIVAQFI